MMPLEQVRPGLWSIPVPIPDNPLRYTLTYAFQDATGVLVVDPGWDSPEGREVLTAALRDLGEVTGIVLTHVHPDHHGLSGWLREQTGAWIGMHPAEAEWLPARRWRDQPPDFSGRWLRRHGAPEDLRLTPDRLDELFAMAEPDRTFDDGDLLPLTGRELRAVWTPGHTPGHLCLHDASAGVLLTGDHLLPRISPNIAVHPGDEGDPLTDYLASLDRTAKFADEEALPAHEYRFRGIDTRAADLRRHHEERGHEILRVVAELGEPTAWAVAARLTWSRGWDALRGLMRRMALAETVAHLHHLAATGSVRRTGTEPERWSR
ncbi:MBL fold metallo-hydrolase [Actinoplanes sp. LDG1-06]|uniref:MBL fold metallo-hydrolase n=1 Tax=Paractinoplanes ovalisporus TaxID=2810368 RepID=A0ABS2A8W8_9ACTN|nr:MBL fold metallo-hydrolase [Actinoplanes ovalisporus]MBM2615694.1 MBL fold metallo-hydrolase [Actinoplanes ovalisporus]